MSDMTAGYVLIVDDQCDILDVIGSSLEYYGYRVFCTDQPTQALRFADENKVAILLTDVIMPEMNGEELAARLLHSHPETKVLLMTGYAERCPKYPIVYKPFRMDVLVHRLQTL